MTHLRSTVPTPLAVFVRERLTELGISQSDFCRRSTFDQGLLSKIQNSLVTSLSIESVLKLAVGLAVAPRTVFELIDRMDLHELVMQSYASEYSGLLIKCIESESPVWAAEAHQLINESLNVSKPATVKTRRRRWEAAGI